MNALEEKVKLSTDEELLELLAIIDEYTEEAQAIIRDEVARRDLSGVKKVDKIEIECVNGATIKKYNADDFVALENPFSRVNITIVDSILRESEVPHLIKIRDPNQTMVPVPTYKDVYTQASTLSTDITIETFTVSVHKDFADKARAMIEEHFEVDGNGFYAPRDNDIIDRLKRFGFNDVRLSPKESEEILEVDFSAQEKESIKKYAKLLLEETDIIEEERGQIVFFYDSLEPLIEKLNGAGGITRVDFLAIIEVCKLYCEDPRYDGSLNAIAESILDFFLS